MTEGGTVICCAATSLVTASGRDGSYLLRSPSHLDGGGGGGKQLRRAAKGVGVGGVAAGGMARVNSRLRQFRPTLIVYD